MTQCIFWVCVVSDLAANQRRFFFLSASNDISAHVSLSSFPAKPHSSSSLPPFKLRFYNNALSCLLPSGYKTFHLPFTQLVPICVRLCIGLMYVLVVAAGVAECLSRFTQPIPVCLQLSFFICRLGLHPKHFGSLSEH